MKKGNNPALNEAAKEFNDSLLDAQKKKIDELLKVIESRNNVIEKLSDKISHLGKAIRKKNNRIEKLHAEGSKHLQDKVKVFYENQDLEKLVKDKDAVLSDVAEELRLSKIREEELTATVKDYLKEIEGLKKKLANIVVNNVDAQALKSAESALAYKEKVIDRLKKKLAERKKSYAISISHPEIIIPHNDFMEILRLW